MPILPNIKFVLPDGQSAVRWNAECPLQAANGGAKRPQAARRFRLFFLFLHACPDVIVCVERCGRQVECP